MYDRIKQLCEALEQYLLGAIPFVALLEEDLMEYYNKQMESKTPDPNLTDEELVRCIKILEPLITKEGEFGVKLAQLRNITHIIWVRRGSPEPVIKIKQDDRTMNRLVELMKQLTPEEVAKLGLKNKENKENDAGLGGSPDVEK